MANQVKPCIIVGGGIVGGLAALLLAQGGMQVTVLDRSPILDLERVFEHYNPRSLALTQATIQLLKKANVWQSILDSQRYIPYTGMKAWNNAGYGEVLLGKECRDALPHEWLGVMIEPSVLSALIQQQLIQQVKDYRPNTMVQSLDKQSKQGKTIWQVQLEQGETLSTHLIIGADGAHSFVREQAMIGLDVLDYHQSVISCAVKSEHHHLHVPRQMYNPTPFALLPMAAKHADDNGYLHSLAWTLPTDIAQSYVRYDQTQFEQLLNKESGRMLGKLQLVSTPTAFPIKARSAQRYVDDGLALIGDAAHTIHPLAGQGMNLGCLDAAILVDALLHDLERGSWAEKHTLQRYEHRRRGHNLVMMHSMSAMGFGERLQDTPLRWVINWGRKQVNQTALIRQFLMYQASGKLHLRQTRYAL